MFYNRQGTFIPEKEFEKIKKSFVLKNQKKIHQMKLGFWGWQKLPTNLEYYKEVNINGKKYARVPAGIKGVWEDKIENKYGKIKHIEIPDLNNPYKGNELDIKQDKIVADMSEKLTALGYISTGLGKAQGLNSKLLTDNGWIKMGEVKLGDKIFAGDGTLTTVTGIFPQGKKDIYEIIFSDGTKAESCLEHLWTVQDINDRSRAVPSYKNNRNTKLANTRTITLAEIKDNIIAYKGTKSERVNYSVNYNEPVQFSKKNLEIHPYILGVLLGDGTLGNHISFSNSEEDIVNKISVLLVDGDYISSTKDKRCNSTTNRINNKNAKHSKSNILEGIIKYGLQYTKADEKFIPTDYLYSCIEDRLDMLRGLFDTDGYVMNGRYSNTQIEYSTVSKQLMDDVEFLVRSLGGRIMIKKRKSKYLKDGVHYECKDHYRATITLHEDIVSSKKHLARYTKTKTKIAKKYIKEVNYVRTEEAQCIMVDNHEHLYITDNFTVTHNTSITAKLIKNKSVKTLIVCSGITLMQQMKMDLKDIFGKDFFTIGGPKRKQKDACHDIVIGNIDTLVKQDKKFFEEFDMIILDEVDTYLGSEKRIEFVFSLTTKWIYGITGTIEVNHTDDKIFNIFFGPKFELLEKNFTPTYYKVFSQFHFNLLDMKDMHLMKEALYNDEDREELIMEILETSLGNRKGIVFLEYVEQAKRLRDKIEEKGIKTFLLIGEISKDEREKVKQEIKDYKGPCVLLGNVRIIGRGLNIPELSLGIMATAEKFNSNINQYIGRIIRKHPNKESAVWYDIIDSKVKMLKGMAYARETTFKKEFKGGKVLYYNLD